MLLNYRFYILHNIQKILLISFPISLFPKSYLNLNKPRGKESTEVQKSQIKGKESENS